MVPAEISHQLDLQFFLAISAGSWPLPHTSIQTLVFLVTLFSSITFSGDFLALLYV
jgi:hypothetical protein